MRLTDSRKKAKKISQPLSKSTHKFQPLPLKKENRKKNSGDCYGGILTVSRTLTKILTVSRKSHHPTGTLHRVASMREHKCFLFKPSSVITKANQLAVRCM